MSSFQGLDSTAKSQELWMYPRVHKAGPTSIWFSHSPKQTYFRYYSQKAFGLSICSIAASLKGQWRVRKTHISSGLWSSKPVFKEKKKDPMVQHRFISAKDEE